jgi:hypothetical protein
VTVRITSWDTTKALISPDATTVGTSVIDVFIANGQDTYQNFYVQGVQGQGNTGDVVITASSPLFTDGTMTVHIVPTFLKIENLASSMSAGALDDPFQIRTGIGQNYSGGNPIYWWVEQPVSATAPLHVTAQSSNGTVGWLRTGAYYGATVTVDVPINSALSPATVLAGGVSFDPLATGNTDVSVSTIGSNDSYAGRLQNVTVTP